MTKTLCLLAVLAIAALAHAAPPPTYLNYQGYLAISSDTLPYTGTVNLVVSIYDAVSGGTQLWSETHNGVAVTKGFYNIVLGQTTPIEDPSIFDNWGLFLEVSVNGDVMAPRKLVTSVARSAWSYLAEKATSATSATSATNATNATNASHAVWSDSATYATTAGSAPLAPHNHLGERWSVNPGSLGLSMRLDAASASPVYGYVDTVYNTGAGTANGVNVSVYGNNAIGLRRAFFGVADNGNAGPAYAGDFQTNGSTFGYGERRGVNAYAYLYYNGGPVYGVYSYAYCDAAQYAGNIFGGNFKAEGGNGTATKYGIYATATSSGYNYAVYATASGGTTNYAGYFAGNLTTTGKLNFASTYTPTSSADANGSVGDISYDANYIYVKTASGWRRAALGTW